MHMADALISPAVGGIMWAAAVGTAAYSIKKLKYNTDEKKIPMMGVMGAFIFAAQMINFAIPGTGSSGHIGGGLLLAIVLGPYAGFLAMTSVLLIQALVFADGGLLALGCNLFNLGFFTCYIAYPLIYRKITAQGMTQKRIFAAVFIAVVAGLQLGSFSVVLQTLLSGKTELPFGTFLLFMQPIHLAIGAIEGAVTAAVVSFVWRSRPEILGNVSSQDKPEAMPEMSESIAAKKLSAAAQVKKLMLGILAAAILTGGVLSWFAAENPDGLEWSINKVTGTSELEADDSIHRSLGELQKKTAVLPEYSIGAPASKGDVIAGSASDRVGTSVSGLAGGAATLFAAVLLGSAAMLLKRKQKK